MAAPPTHSALTQGRPSPSARQPTPSSSSSFGPQAERSPLTVLLSAPWLTPYYIHLPWSAPIDASHNDQPAEPAIRPHRRDLCCPGDCRPRGVPAHPQSTDRRSPAVSCTARGGEL